jgi:6-phosphofructokinase
MSENTINAALRRLDYGKDEMTGHGFRSMASTLLNEQGWNGDAIERQRSTVGSHERVGIFRVFGRDAGYTALYTAYVTSIRCCIPEYVVNLDKLIDILMVEKRSNESNYVLVVLSEGAKWEGYTVQEYGEPDAFGHRKKAAVRVRFRHEAHNFATRRIKRARRQ